MPTFLVPSRQRSGFRPHATIAIGAVTLAAFVLEEALGRGAGGSQNNDVLVRMGASHHKLVWGPYHQIFRLLCPAFLHIGFFHILANGYAFLQLAPFVERIWGSSRFLIVYVLSAFGGCVASSCFGGALSAGASGAVFGLIGFLIAAGWSGRQRHEVRTLIRTYFGQGLVFWAGYNLYLGYLPGSNVDNLGHVGGLVTGLVLGTLVTGVVRATPLVRGIAAACVLAVAASFVACAVRGGAVLAGEDESRALTPFEETYGRALAAYHARDLEGAVHLCDLAIHKEPDDPRIVDAYALEASALRLLGRDDDAKLVCEVSWRTRPTLDAARTLESIAIAQSDTRAAAEWAARAAALHQRARDGAGTK